jgi:ubiquinone/menaquinone biosynthesis C-methylase UbiE
LRWFPQLDTRARFVAQAPRGGSLLDLGSSDGETLRHISELRPDLRLHAVDVAGRPENYPSGCEFQRADLEREKLSWPDNSMDAITCMHLVEHLNELTLLLEEVARLLKGAGAFTLNFHDDPTHIRPVAIETLAERTRATGLESLASGTSRNWLFAAAHPLFMCMPPSRKKFTARVHWLGWSAYLVARRPL